jgi:hypothetical protein
MCRSLSVFFIHLVVLSAALQAQETTRPSIAATRHAWDLSDEERIAARTNAGAAKNRVDEYLDSHSSPQSTRAKVLAVPRKLVSVVDGGKTPELFLPAELFEMVVNLGLVSEDNWRDVWDPGVKAAGLPPDFWRRLERTTAVYAADLRAAQQAGIKTRELPEDRGSAADFPRALLTQLCHDRADALSASRATFGVALDIFMYQTIAPGHVVTIFDDPEEPARLRSMARGCR